MELPHLGKHCMENSCKKLDFLPITCDACMQIFCDDHFTYKSHNCSKAYLKNNQVPVCPLCNIPIPVSRGQQPDIVVGAHIDNDCQSDPAKNRRKVFTNKCSKKGCKVKEVIPVICSDCKYNFCLKHRHPTDHNCLKSVGSLQQKAREAAEKRTTNMNNHSQPVGNDYSQVQGNMSEDEALARALAMSMGQVESNSLSQEELDLALARQIQMETVSVRENSRSNSNSSRCQVQ